MFPRWLCCTRRRMIILSVLVMGNFLLAISYISSNLSKIERNSPTIPTGNPSLQSTNEFHNKRSVSGSGVSSDHLKEEVTTLFPCELTSREVLSAVARASTSECKSAIGTVYCLNKDEKLYPTQLPSYCPLRTASRLLGCFATEAFTNAPGLGSGQGVVQSSSSSSNTISSSLDQFSYYGDPQGCVNYCIRYGYPYIALLNGTRCSCVTQVALDQAVPEQHCTLPCSILYHTNQDPTSCDKSYASLYSTGLNYTSHIPPTNPPQPTSSSSTKLNNRHTSPLSNNKTSTQHQKHIRIAFILSLNGRSLRQTLRLLRAIYRPYHTYVVHVDSRQDYLYRKLLPLERDLPNFHLLERRLATIWGGASLLQMIKASISYLLQMDENWDFVLNLSETDFPIRPLSELEAYLAANKDRNFVKSHGHETHKFITKQGLDKTFHECDTHMWRVGNRFLPSGILFDGGSDWVVLSRRFAQYVTTGNDELIHGLNELFRYTLLPVESYFHTLLHNSEFCGTVVDSNLRITNWKRKQGCKCQYKHVVDWCGCSPNVFTGSDWKKIDAGRQKNIFFARKFDATIDLQAINRLELLVSNEDSSPDLPLKDSWTQYWYNECELEDLTSASAAGSGCDAVKLSVYHHMASNMATLYRGNDTSLLSGCIKDNELHWIQTNSLFTRNSYTGAILQAAGLQPPLLAEFYLKPRKTFKLLVPHGSFPVSHLNALKVCSGYDAKEQVFRNWDCLMGSTSEVAIEHRWRVAAHSSPHNFSITFVWIDPTNSVAGSYEIRVEQSTTPTSLNLALPEEIVLLHKPPFQVPLQVGLWRVLLLYEWIPRAQIQFPVYPVTMDQSGQSVFNQNTSQSISMSANQLKKVSAYTEHNFKSVEKLLKLVPHPPDAKGDPVIEESEAESYVTAMMSNLIWHFWSLEASCVHSFGASSSSTTATAKTSSRQCLVDQQGSSPSQLPACSATQWSSFAPDEKSTFPPASKSSANQPNHSKHSNQSRSP